MAEVVVGSVDGMGIEPSNLINFQVKPGNGSIRVRFTEPKDTIIDSQTLCSIKGVYVVYKEGSFPEDENDGILALDCTEIGKYSFTDYEITGLKNGTTYYVQLFPYSDNHVCNRNKRHRAVVTPQEYTLLGYKISKTNTDPETRVVYTEQAVGLTPARVNLSTGEFSYGSFANFWFITENRPFMVYTDGTPAYELDHNDHTLKIDGTPSDISNVAFRGNAMSLIPKVYIKQWEDSEWEYVNICNVALDDSYKVDAYIRSDGTVADYFWLSMFEGTLQQNMLRSLKGFTPMTEQTGQKEIEYAKANGSLWYTRTHSQRNVINCLLTLISKSDDSQSAFGYGYHTGGTNDSPNLLTTGMASDKGQFYGTNKDRDVVKVFYIENWWGDIWERIAGLMIVNGTIHVKMKPPYNTTGEGYIDTGIVMSGTSAGYISETKMTEYGRLPVKVAGSQTTFTCDGGWFNNGQDDYAVVGGNCNNGLHAGASCVGLSDVVSTSYWLFGSALSCEQSAV